ncbi:MAG: transposase, partial [Nitrospirota bacterium]
MGRGYRYCESRTITYFIRLKRNRNLDKLAEQPMRRRPTGRFPKSGIKIKTVGFYYRAANWKKHPRVVSKIEWHFDEVFPRVEFISTNSRLPTRKVVDVYNSRGDVENRIKEGKNKLRWD